MNTDKTGNTPTLINIGCGDQNTPEYINIDARPLPGVDIVKENIFDLSEFDSNFADLIYMSHLLEHISWRKTHDVLKEMHRVIKPGGVLRVSVPDFNKLLFFYTMHFLDMKAIHQALLGAQDYEHNYHYNMFNKKSLTDSLLTANFKKVRTWNPKKAKHYNFHDWAIKKLKHRWLKMNISLNLEAIK